MKTSDKEHVFVCLDQTPFCEQYYGQPFIKRQHLMERLCKKAKVKPFGFHGVDPLQERVHDRDHQSDTTTREPEHYGKVHPQSWLGGDEECAQRRSKGSCPGDRLPADEECMNKECPQR